MSDTRANMIKARGLVTHGNELSRPEGSLKQAINVNVDEDGVVTPRRGFNDYAGPTGGAESATGMVNQILEYKDAIIRQYQNKLEYEDTSNNFQPIDGTYNVLREGYRTKWQEASSNLFFTTDEGIKKMSVKNRADLNAGMITDAGGLKAGYASGLTVPTVGGFLPPESKVAYRVLYGTRDANNNLIYGSPSSRVVVTNFSADVSNPETSSITVLDQANILDVDTIYFTYTNTTGKYVIYFDRSGTLDEPQTAETIGGIYIKVAIGSSAANDSIAAILANAMSVIPNTEISIDATNPDKVDLVDTTNENIVGFTDSKKATGANAGDSAESIINTDNSSDGSISQGASATVTITGVVPNNATTEYFYQVYRSGTISVSSGLTINDLDPGDELNIVYESGLTQPEIDAGEFIFTDTTPESFRAEAAPLYTNETTGEGILQSNEPPPIALDVELFRNYMFYANTKGKHKVDFTIVSVDDIISNSTRFLIGNSDTSRYYTFVGSAEVVDVTIDDKPDDGDSILVSSANDEREYYIWFDDGGINGDPEVPGAVGYRIDISDIVLPMDAAKRETIASRIESAMIDNVDVNLSATTNIITFTHTNNGYTEGVRAGAALTNVTIAIPSVAGTGELSATDEGGDVLISGLLSVGQAIDETARSLVKIISKDPLSPVNAFYLSTGEDLPGNILLEAKSLEDKNFYVAIEEAGNDQIGGEFTPEIPYSIEISELTVTTTDRTITTVSNHGFTTNDQVFISFLEDTGAPSGLNSFSGVYIITVTGLDTFTIAEGDAAIGTVNTPSFSAVYPPDVESENDEIKNRIYYSKRNEPEAVPIENFIDVGPQDAEIKRILALRDNLFVLKDDGIYVVSGTSAPDWSVRLIDSTRIIAPDSAVVLNNQIYCLTEQGITRVTGSGAAVISRGIEDEIDAFTNQGFDFASNTFGIAYENDRAYIMFAPSSEIDESAVQAFRYNMFEQTWTKWEYEANCGRVLARNNKLYVGNADRNYVSEERKDNERTDHADRNFSATINTDGVSSEIIELSSLVGVEVNDVIVQEQDVTINYFNNRLLRKMDFFDSGITAPVGSTMYDSFFAVAGDNMAAKMQELNDYLNTLDPTYITARSYTLANVRANTEALVIELNTTETITAVKTYKNPITVYYEAYIRSVDKIRNQITVHIERPFVENTIEVFKGFTKTIEWNPQHYGDPSALKQIRYVTIMFDQNNFYEATAKFASDVSQAVNTVEFKGKGIGYWGDMPWSDPNHYWGGVGNDIPFRNPVPRGKQKCRYLSLTFEHKNAREDFKIVGISGVVRAISDRGYR